VRVRVRVRGLDQQAEVQQREVGDLAKSRQVTAVSPTHETSSYEYEQILVSIQQAEASNSNSQGRESEW
jgi:hypothetical protein